MSYSKQNFRSGDTLYASQLNAMDNEIAALEAEVESTKNMVGSPLTASTAAGMTDQTKIYVYTGSETGYTAGHWYYYNGTAWTDGGVYNSVAVNTDTSLTVSGQAADSKAVGDAIDEMDSDLSDVKETLSDLNTATSEDVGKVLKVKTVTSGKVSEWEFSEIPDTVEIDDTAEKGDTDKVWSADKLTGKFDKVDNVLKAFGGNASFIWAWEEGSYGNMAEDPPTSKSNYGPGVVVKRIRSSFSMTATEKVTFATQTGYKCLYSVYKDGTRIEYESSTYKAVDKTYTGAGTYTFYVNLANTSDTAIGIDEANSGLVVLTDNTVANINDAIAENAEKIESVDEKYADAFDEAFPGNPMFSIQWLLGGYANLADNPPVSYNTGNTRARVKVSVDVKNKLTISCASGYKYVYSIYKGSERKSYQASSWQTTPSVEFAYGAGTYTLYMNVSNSSNSAITTDEAKAAITILADNAVLDIYEAVAASGGLTETRNLFDPEASNTLRGYYNSSNTWQNVSGFGQTDFVAVKQGVKYDTPLKSVFVNWYNSSKEFISSTSGSTYNTQGYVIPVENAAYAKFIFRTTEHQDFYIHSDESGSVSIPLDDIPYGLNNQFKGKNGVAFGTSLTYRAKSTGGYLEYLPVMLQMDFDNQGLGNSTILEHQDHTDMMGMITGYTGYADKDVVIIEGFVNDWYDNSDKLGTWKDEGVITSTTVCGRIRYALNYILTQNPYATIIMILDPYGQAYNGNPGCASTVVKSGYTQMEYYEEIAKLAASMAIPTIKGYALSGMSEATPDYYIDIIHPSPLGAKQFANVIWENMKSIPIKVHN